jgi:hypothetical protein
MSDLPDTRMQELVDTLNCPDPDEVAAMIDEIRRRRAAASCRYCDMGHREHRAGCPMLVLCEADRGALQAAAAELKERRKWMRACEMTAGTEQYRDECAAHVAACDAALAVIERLGGTK